MTARPPRVSIGLPVYNGEEYLDDALASARRQSFEDIEIIVSDNGSTDGTSDLCRQAAAEDDRVVYRRYDENRGGGWNYMNVARLARGEYFTWLAADDVKLPGFTGSCVELLDADGRAAFACSRAQVIDEQGVVIETLHDGAMGLDAPDAAARVRNLLRAQASHVVYGLIRSSVLRQTRGMIAMVGDDIVLNTELLCRGPMLQSDEFLFRPRRHGAQLSQQGHEQVRWHAPRAAVRFAFPQTRLNAELFRAVARAPLPAGEKVRAWSAVASSWVVPRWRGMARDVAVAAGWPVPAP
ncbi:glycosyltransferase family 2 protein [Isoptericola haloaureus]|uniref:Glycosyltransferase family 2 protein n=1 Tax=Isoptericola haloaureus TaxID=1542902 RepID=A0ABU7Z4N8_9MICO